MHSNSTEKVCLEGQKTNQTSGDTIPSLCMHASCFYGICSCMFLGTIGQKPDESPAKRGPLDNLTLANLTPPPSSQSMSSNSISAERPQLPDQLTAAASSTKVSSTYPELSKVPLKISSEKPQKPGADLKVEKTPEREAGTASGKTPIVAEPAARRRKPSSPVVRSKSRKFAKSRSKVESQLNSLRNSARKKLKKLSKSKEKKRCAFILGFVRGILQASPKGLARMHTSKNLPVLTQNLCVLLYFE